MCWSTSLIIIIIIIVIIIIIIINVALQAETGRRIDRTEIFPASESEISINFVIMDDDIALEDIERITWTLTFATMSDRASVSPINTTNIQIVDDDGTYMQEESN